MRDPSDTLDADWDDRTPGPSGCSPSLFMIAFMIAIILALGIVVGYRVLGWSLSTDRVAPVASATPSTGGQERSTSGVSGTPTASAPATGCSVAVSLPNGTIEVIGNGFTQFDVRFGTSLPDAPRFALAGEPTIEAIQLMTAMPDAGGDANEWDVTLDRIDDRPFPLGLHELTLEVSIGSEVCRLPITLDVVPYS